MLGIAEMSLSSAACCGSAVASTIRNPASLLYQGQFDEALLAGSMIDPLHGFPVVLGLGPED
jgi:hypothetical protein